MLAARPTVVPKLHDGVCPQSPPPASVVMALGLRDGETDAVALALRATDAVTLALGVTGPLLRATGNVAGREPWIPVGIGIHTGEQ